MVFETGLSARSQCDSIKNVLHSEWSRHDDEVAAIDRLLDAAGAVFATKGLAKASMIEVCRAAGCSRTTLYRYFPNLRSVQLAFVERAIMRIVWEMTKVGADVDASPEQHLVEWILSGVAATRADEHLAAWFEPENLAVPLALADESTLLQSMATATVQELSTDLSDEEVHRAVRWLLHCIAMLLVSPCGDAEEERAIVESFIVPSVSGTFRLAAP